ncbi:MAG: hypothetical protein AAF074_12590 [Pseudomonadota bacterium]
MAETSERVMDTAAERVPVPESIVLFYDGFEMQAIDRPYGRLYSDLRGTARWLWRTAKRVQPYTGYYVAFRNLCRSLSALGCEVRINDFAAARRNPGQVIGLSGYASVHKAVSLENPAIFGPGYVPPPPEVERVMAESRIRIMTVPSEWPAEIYRPVLGERVQPFFVGIDTEAWPDLSGEEKTLDCLIYDKVRFERETREPLVGTALRAHLDARGRSHQTIRYGHHHTSQFRGLLKRARSLVFVCEHETQGLAYQEALSSGVPVFAWEEEALFDPTQRKYAPEGLRVSSVPYFDKRCGVKFTLEDLGERFDAFWERLEGFAPRDYVTEVLSLEASARRYLSIYRMASGG